MQQPLGSIQGTLARAVAAHQAGKISEAEFLYKLVLQADKKQFDAMHMLAIIEGQRGNFAAGLSRIKEALRVRPNSADALINLGRMQSELGDNDSAVATYKKALKLDSQSPLAHNNMSIVLRRLHRAEEALLACDAALAIAQNLPDAWNNRGNALADLDRSDEALESYNRALALQPTLADAQLGRGNVLSKMERRDEALAAYDKALALNPNLAAAWLGRGAILTQNDRRDEALVAYNNAATAKPDLAEAWLGRGTICVSLGQFHDAFAAYDKALALKPDLTDVWVGRGAAYSELRQYDEAYAAYDTAFRMQPELENLEGNRLHAKQCLCDWAFLADDAAFLLGSLRSAQPFSAPFPLLAIPSTAADQLQCARRYSADLRSFPPLRSGTVYAHDRIRLAYLSSDFREHPLAFLTAGLFEEHDKSRFELTAISYGPDEAETDMRRRLKSAFERFVDVGRQSDKQAAELIRELEIDIAVDLNGITQNARPGILSRRPAPVQATYLGYASTMGADYIDYVIADSTIIPRNEFDCFTEKVVWLPDSFMVQDARRSVAERIPTRAECGLPENGVVFCCFNNSFKIAPEVFKTWMRVMQATENSVLWLSNHSAPVVANLRREAEASGVAADRLIFAPRIGAMADHLARHRQADLFVDTLPYNAHATASDALWAGLPVLTCLGTTFAGRVAASLNYAVGMGELVTNSLEEYEALAMKIAHDPALLAALKARLAANRKTYPLFDTRRFARNIEVAYTTMWQRSQRGEAPQSFAVDAVPASAN
jgi:protein O-GlcNAc transferase